MTAACLRRASLAWIALLTSGFVAGLALAADGTPATTTVTITITNIKRAGGALLAGVYDKEGTWLGAETFARKEVPVPTVPADGTVRFELRLPPGRYGVSVFHDRNGNRKLDTNFLGIPTESSGSSRDAPARLGPPKFKDAVVTIGTDPVALSIRLN
jgi:uncharacterized protein (DUF2141 family)